MIIKPSDFAQKIFYINGMPLKFSGSHRHLLPIYNKPSKSILLQFGRQTHKSTTVGFKLSLPCLMYKNFHSLYVAPTMKQVGVFSDDKLDSALSSPVIQDNYFDTKTKDQGSYKEFVNLSKLYLRSAYNSADSIRGISADQAVFDEVQDLISDHIPVIEQCMSHSIAKWMHLKEFQPSIPVHIFNSKIYAGTPKSAENTMEQYHRLSTKCEWVIHCKHCNKHNYINEHNIGKTCLICNKCGKPIHYRDGNWVEMDPGKLIDGYRMPQIVLDWVNNEHAWVENVIKPIQKYSTEKVYNEILALPYSTAKHPLSRADMTRACNGSREMFPESPDRDMLKGTFFAGIDWGKGDTASGTSYSVLTIGRHMYGRVEVVFTKKYTGRMSEPLIQIKDMLSIINHYGVRLTIADYGDGRVANAMMVEALGAGNFAELYETGTQKKKITWDGVKGIYLINRTQVMTDLFMEIKRKEVEFYRLEDLEPYMSDFTGIYSEYSESTRSTRYDHNVPDDAFHSYMFMRCAQKIITGDYSKYLSGGE